MLGRERNVKRLMDVKVKGFKLLILSVLAVNLAEYEKEPLLFALTWKNQGRERMGGE